MNEWLREVSWCADLLAMFKRWCDVRQMDPSWFYDLHSRREWVRMNVWLGDAQSHKIVAIRQAGGVTRIIGGENESGQVAGRQEDQADGDVRSRSDPSRH